jgi:hypothetical protein
MKASTNKSSNTPEAEVFPKALHRVRPNSEKPVATEKSKKRDNVFSKSRDTREDRGERKVKTSSNSQTFSHR